MRYEKVILEMMERIQALEVQVKELQEKLVETDSPKEVVEESAPVDIQQVIVATPAPHRTNGKVTEKMLDACYEAGKKALSSEYADVVVLAGEVCSKTGMNKNNALMTIFAVIALLNGELYKRAISGKATARYFDNILRDYGKGKLQNAIAAMRMHVNYRRALHHNVDLLEQICDRYQKMI